MMTIAMFSSSMMPILAAPQTYNFNFDCGGYPDVTYCPEGEEILGQAGITYAELIPEEPIPTRTGYTFLGWSTSSSAESIVDWDNDQANGATDLIAIWEQESQGEEKTVPISLSTAPATFSVTVPTTLEVAMKEDGTSEVGEAVITNNSDGPVRITNVTIKSKGGWKLVSYDKDFAKLPVDTQEFGFMLNGIKTTASGYLFDSGNFPVIETDGTGALEYSANMALQSKSEPAAVADVIFTVDWERQQVETPSSVDEMVSQGKTLSEVREIYTDEDILTSETGYSLYSVGDTATLSMDGYGDVLFDVVGKNHDGDNTITLVTRNALENSVYGNGMVRMDYENSQIDKYLNTTVLSKFDIAVQNAIKEVPKQTYIYSTTSTATINRKLWALSYTEVGLNGDSYAPTEGENYGFWNSDASRVKTLNGNASDWWLRSPNTTSRTEVLFVGNNGSDGTIGITMSYGLVFGLVFGE